MSHLKSGGCRGPTFFLWKGTSGITGRWVEGMAYAGTNFSGTLTAPTTTTSLPSKAPIVKHLALCIGASKWLFSGLFCFSHPFLLPPDADSVSVSDCLGSHAHLLMGAVILLRSMSHSKFLAVEQTTATAPAYPYMRTGCWIPTLAATIGA